MATAELVVAKGKRAGQRIKLPAGKFLVGREEDCHLRPNSDLVSRHHCVFITDEYAVRLRDLGSTNGTYINGEALHGSQVLEDGMELEFGGLTFKVELQASVAAEPPAGDAAAVVLDAPAAETSEDDSASDVAAASESPTVVNEGETMYDMPAAPPVPESDTQFAPMQPPQMPQQPVGYPPQYAQQYPGYPPQGYPQQYPGYPPQGYPQQYPGYPPQGYPQQYPGYPAADQSAAPEPDPVEEEPASKPGAVNISLPDPSQTGAKEPEKKAEGGEKKSGAGQGGGEVKSVAADLIRKRHGR